MKEEIAKAKEIIQKGGIILYPTDTIWGIGCDPSNESAIEKIYALKERADNKSCIILVNSERLLSRYVKEIPDVCYDLVDLAVSPLTVIYPRAQYISKKIMAEDGSIGIRMVKDEFCSGLITALKSGIVSTSANRSGQPSPIGFKDIDDQIKNGVDYIVNLPNYQGTSKPSQIIKISEKSEVQIIRK